MDAVPLARRPPTRSPQHTELHLGPLSEVRVSVWPAPLVTLLSLVVDALGGPQQGVSPEWVRLVRSAMPMAATRAVCPVVDRSTVTFPDCLAPIGSSDEPVPALLERIAAVPPDVFCQSVTEVFDGQRLLMWQAAMQRPRAWLGQYVTVLSAAWQAYAPIWRQLTALHARETERVGSAVVGGGLDLLLAGISARTRLFGDTLCLPDRSPHRVELGTRRLVLVPLASGFNAAAFNLDLPDLVWFGYPLSGLSAVRPGDLSNAAPAPGPDALTCLLGPVRASVLRVLRRPTTMGALARLLNAAPSTVTYHCAQLASAGLVLRRRDGREVHIERTPRGDAVVDLLS